MRGAASVRHGFEISSSKNGHLLCLVWGWGLLRPNYDGKVGEDLPKMRRSYKSILFMMIQREAVLMADCVGLAELISWMFRGRNGGRRRPAKGKVFAWMRDSRIRKERNCHLASSLVIRVAPN